MTTEDEFKPIFLDMVNAFPEFKPASPMETMKLYARMLRDVPAEALRIAADEWIGSMQWFPKISQLREKAGGPGHWRTNAPKIARVLEPLLICKILPDGWHYLEPTNETAPIVDKIQRKRLDELDAKDDAEWTETDTADYIAITGITPYVMDFAEVQA